MLGSISCFAQDIVAVNGLPCGDIQLCRSMEMSHAQPFIVACISIILYAFVIYFFGCFDAVFREGIVVAFHGSCRACQLGHGKVFPEGIFLGKHPSVVVTHLAVRHVSGIAEQNILP